MSRPLVIGLGDAGMNIAHFLQGQTACRVLAVNTDANALEQSGFARQLLMGPRTCRGGRANMPARGRRAAEESRDLLKDALAGIEALVLIAGLGGGTGSGAAAVIIDLAQSMGLRIIVAVVLPFEFETDRREIAFSTLPDLQSKGVQLLVYDNADAIDDQGNRTTSLLEIFQTVAREVATGIGAKLACEIDSYRDNAH